MFFLPYPSSGPTRGLGLVVWLTRISLPSLVMYHLCVLHNSCVLGSILAVPRTAPLWTEIVPGICWSRSPSFQHPLLGAGSSQRRLCSVCIWGPGWLVDPGLSRSCAECPFLCCWWHIPCRGMSLHNVSSYFSFCSSLFLLPIGYSLRGSSLGTIIIWKLHCLDISGPPSPPLASILCQSDDWQGISVDCPDFVLTIQLTF